jgi:hypothetical protein
MTRTPQAILVEMHRLEKRSRMDMSPIEREAHEAAEIKLDERLHRFNLRIANQQHSVGEAVIRGDYVGVHVLMAMYGIANAHIRF